MISISMLHSQQNQNNQIVNRWKQRIDEFVNKNIKCSTKITKNSQQNKNVYIIGIQSFDYPSIILRNLLIFQVKAEVLMLIIKTIDSYGLFTSSFMEDDQNFNEEFQAYLSLINMKNKNIQGCFYTQKKNNFALCYSCQINLSITQHNISLSLFLSNVLRLFSQQLNHFTIHFKLLNQNSPQNEHKLTRQLKNFNQSKTTNSFTLLNRMRILKQHFENQRNKRQKSTSCYLGFNKIKIISYLQQACSLNFINLNRFKLPEYISKHQVKQIYEEIKSSQQLKDKKQMDHQISYIVCPIQIHKAQHEQYCKEGGYSKINKGLYEYQYCQTIYKNQYNFQSMLKQATNNNNRKQFQFENKYPMKTQKKILIKKQPKQINDQSFVNEFKALIYLRNKKQRYIANYYLDLTRLIDENKEANSLKYIFLDIYQCNLKEIMKKWSKRKKIRILNQIIRGISFLQENKILHRDLKQQNIMIDKEQNARIIDFGSCCGFYDNNQKDCFKTAFNDLRSTPGYFLSYQDVNGTSITSKYTQQQYERSPYFDMYSFGHIIQNLFQKQFLQCDGILDYQLYYLSKKCKQFNPADRLNYLQIKLYLNMITYLFIEEINFTKQKQKKIIKMK